jgi:hypothetical protein
MSFLLAVGHDLGEGGSSSSRDWGARTRGLFVVFLQRRYGVAKRGNRRAMSECSWARPSASSGRCGRSCWEARIFLPLCHSYHRNLFYL